MNELTLTLAYIHKRTLYSVYIYYYYYIAIKEKREIRQPKKFSIANYVDGNGDGHGDEDENEEEGY